MSEAIFLPNGDMSIPIWDGTIPNFFAMKFDSMEQEFMKSKFPKKKAARKSSAKCTKTTGSLYRFAVFFTLYPESS